MSSSAISQRIFIVGAPRSGTTLVQSLLAAHSRATSFTESHFFSRHFRAFPSAARAVLLRDPRPRLAEFLAENGVDASGRIERRFGPLMPIAPLPPLLAARTRPVTAEFLQMLDDLALERDRPVWIEKTPRHLRYIPFIERNSDALTRFVHVIRRGVDVVSSLHLASKEWERAYSLDECVRRWNQDVAFSLQRAESSADPVVFYEELTAEPEAALKRLVVELRLDWEPEMLDGYRAESARLTAPGERWKAKTVGEIRPSHASSRALTDQQRVRLDQALDPDLYRRFTEIRRRNAKVPD